MLDWRFDLNSAFNAPRIYTLKSQVWGKINSHELVASNHTCLAGLGDVGMYGTVDEIELMFKRGRSSPSYSSRELRKRHVVNSPRLASI